MSATRLTTRTVEKPWGRHTLGPGFEMFESGAEPVGEIWFENPRPGRDDPDLLVKYLFTSEKLSVQVHPDDAMAKAMGLPRGKNEAWVVVDAEPHAMIGIGLREVLTAEALRAAALDGSIENILDWRAVVAGDVFYSPSGTIHAIGPGVTLVEIQQNCDTTFRLYDYGRARELHIDEAVAAADPVPYIAPYAPRSLGDGRTILANSSAFTLERWSGAQHVVLPASPGPIWLVPLSGAGAIDGAPLAAGEVWLVEDGGSMVLGAGSELLLAYSGDRIVSINR